MTATNLPPYLCEVNPAEWAFTLLKRTRDGLVAIPPHPRHRNENLSVFLAWDDSDLYQ